LQLIDYLREENQCCANTWAKGDYASTMTSGGQPRDWEASFSERWQRLSHARPCCLASPVDRAENMMAVANKDAGARESPGENEDLMVRMAKENRRCEYRRIHGALPNLRHGVGRGTIAEMSARHG